VPTRRVRSHFFCAVKASSDRDARLLVAPKKLRCATASDAHEAAKTAGGGPFMISAGTRVPFFWRETMNAVPRGWLVAAVLLAPTLCMAQAKEPTRPAKTQFNYTYAEIGYDKHDFDVEGAPNSIDGDALTFSGAFQLKDNWHLYGSYSNADVDFGINLDTWTIGVGYSYPLKKDIELYGRVLYIDTTADFGSTSSHDDGLGFQFRVRGRVNPKIEVEGGIQYIDVASTDTSLQASVRYYFTREFSAGVGLTFGGDSDGLGINARYNF
jgi:hypothetical protein